MNCIGNRVKAVMKRTSEKGEGGAYESDGCREVAQRPL